MLGHHRTEGCCPGVVHLNFTVTWPIMRSARAVVARAPPEIMDQSDFGANIKAMRKWCIYLFLFSRLTLKIFSKMLPFSCLELIGLLNDIHCIFYPTISKITFHLNYKKRWLRPRIAATISCQWEILFLYLQQIVLEASIYWMIPVYNLLNFCLVSLFMLLWKNVIKHRS